MTSVLRLKFALSLAAAFAVVPALAQAESLTDPNVITTMKLSDYVCTEDPKLADSFGVSSCDAFKVKVTQQVAAATRHIIAFLYEGISLQMDFRDSSVNPTGFCKTLSNPATGTVLTFPTPLCNIADPLLTTERAGNVNHLGQTCGVTVPMPGGGYANPGSNGLCDFASLKIGDAVDLEKICPKETTWLKSLRPQAFQSAYESVQADLDAGILTLTSFPDPKSTTGGVIIPCGGFGRSADRIVKGSVKGAAGAKDPGIPSLNEMRISVSKANENPAADEFKFDEKSKCTDLSALTQESTAGGALTAYSNLACQLVYADKFVEYLVAQAALCEMNLRADAKYFGLLKDTATHFHDGISGILAPCKDYAAAQSGIDWDSTKKHDGKNQLFWPDSTVRTPLYACYNSGTGATPPHKGIQAFYRDWIKNNIVVKKGLALAADGADAFPKLPRATLVMDKDGVTKWVTGGKPLTKDDHPPCAGLFLMPALPFWRGRRRKFLAKLLLAATLLFATAQLSPHAFASGAVTIVNLNCPGGGDTKDALNPTCVCDTKRDSCLVKAEQDYDIATTKITNDYYVHKGGDCSDWERNRDCSWDTNPRTSGCGVSCDTTINLLGVCVAHCDSNWTGDCWCDEVKNSAIQKCELTVWYDPNTGRDRLIADQNYADAKALCRSVYMSPTCDQGAVMDYPTGDVNTFKVGMQNCLEQKSEELPTACPPPAPDAQSPPPPHGVSDSQTGENIGETAMLGARELFGDNATHMGKTTASLKNNATVAATAVDFQAAKAPAKSSTPRSTELGGGGPAAAPAAANTIHSGNSGGSKTSDVIGGDFGNTTDASNTDVTDAGAAAAAAAARAAAGEYEATRTGGGGGRSGASTGGVEARGGNAASFGNRAEGPQANADGAIGPRDAGSDLDPNEPYLHGKGRSLFEIVNRRYKKKTASLLATVLPSKH